MEYHEYMSKKVKNVAKKQIAKEIIKYVAMTGGVALCFTAPTAIPFLGIFLCRNTDERNRYMRSLLMLNRRGMLKIIRDVERGNSLQLTRRGNREARRVSFLDMHIDRPKKWDGIWRMVMFDIPQKRRGARAVFRKKLRDLGFLPYQKSVFVFPFPCEREVRFAAEYLSMQPYVQYIEVCKLDKESRVRKEFNLLKQQ